MVEKVDILAIGAHPDDVELSCGGTLLKHLDAGRSAAIVDLTKGELGTRGSAELRFKEADKARQFFGIQHRDNLGMDDGFFQHNEENLRKIVKSIRKFQPEIVLANALSDRHPDHGRAAKLISDACFISGLKKVETELNEQSQSVWRPKAIYHYIQDHNLEPDFVVDISDQLERKLEVILCFGSQFFDPESKEPETPISTANFLEFIKAKAAGYGRQIGATYGEAFNVTRHIGVKDLFDLL